jgi:hypothetical protein
VGGAKTKGEDEGRRATSAKLSRCRESRLVGLSGVWHRMALGPRMRGMIGRVHLQDPLPRLDAEPWG